MKKSILLIAAALLFCSQMKAQDLADASTLTPTLQLSLTDNQQTDLNSIFAIPMPESELIANSQYNTQEYASRKGWGIFCIISGGMTMLGGITTWVGGGIFSNMANGMGDDPDMQQGQQAFNAMGDGVKTIGIIGTVAGAALVGTGIWLVSSDGGSSHGRRGHGRRGGHRRSHRRHAELLPDYENMQPDWGLSLNVTPATAGLTLVF